MAKGRLLRLSIIITVMAFFSTAIATAQQVTVMKTTISAAGQSFLTAGNYSLSQTIAQPSLVNGFRSESLHLLQGFQHPHLRSQEVKQKFDVYPNPTRGHVTIEWHSDIRQEKLDITLFDLAGRKIRKDSIQKLSKSISLDYSEVTSGPYYLFLQGEISGRAYASLLIL